MSVIWLFLLALSLSFDTFAVSVTSGLICNKIKFRQALRFSIIMAAFQGVMPFIGWLTGQSVSTYIDAFDHWIASGLLFFVAFRMIAATMSNHSTSTMNPLKLRTVLMLAFATSIDALAVGISIAFIELDILLAIFIIGAVTFLAAMLGLLIGKKSAVKFGKPLEILGGLILIAIGIKILISHL